MTWPVWVVLALVAAAVIGVGLLAATGRITPDALPEAVSTTPDLDLPRDRALTAEEVEAIRFETGLRGYDPGPVDAHLEAWLHWLRSIPGGAAPQRPDHDSAIFPVVLRGYRMDQVDELLAALER